MSGESGNNLQVVRVNHNAKMVEAFDLMLTDQSMCDVSLCCDGHTLKAHRLILAASSDFFKQILSSINSYSQYPIIFVNGVSVDDLRAILEFMYRGEVTVPQKQLPSLVKSAETLRVSSLSQLDPNAQNYQNSRPAESDATDANNCDTQPIDEEVRTLSPTDSVGSSATTTTTTTTAKKSSKKRRKLMHKEDKHVKENQVVEENWRNSRLRRPPLKFSEYTMSKGLADIKKSSDKLYEDVKDFESIDVKPPSPRLTRGRSRVCSQEEPKESKEGFVKAETPDTTNASLESIPSTSHENLTTAQLTPNTRSRKQTHSPCESKIGIVKQSLFQYESNKLAAVSDGNNCSAQESETHCVSPDDDLCSTRGKTAQLKAQSPNLHPQQPQQQQPQQSFAVSSKLKWCPKNPEMAAKKFLAMKTTSGTELKFQYEALEEVYRCSYCLHSFRSKQNIIDHIKSVHMESNERYVCPLCSKQFKWKTSLNNHLNQVHPLSRPTPMRHFDKTKKSSSSA